MLVKGDNGLVFEVPDSVASSMVSAGTVTPAEAPREGPSGTDPAKPSRSRRSRT